MFLKACLNGSRAPGAHPRLPVTPQALAEAARDAVRAGADALHVHPRAEGGAESLEAGPMTSALLALRAACPGVPVGVSTGAWIEPEPARRVAHIKAWEVLPDFASVNLSEGGAGRVMEALLGRGVGVEAGLWRAADVDRLTASGLEGSCLRLLLEPREADAAEAEATVQQLEAALDAAELAAPRLLHGLDATAWPMFDLAAARGHASRIGFEDALYLPPGELAPDNAALVRAARVRSFRS